MEGTNWVRNVLTTCFIYCGPFFLMFCFNNAVAWTHGVRSYAYAHSLARCQDLHVLTGY